MLPCPDIDPLWLQVCVNDQRLCKRAMIPWPAAPAHGMAHTRALPPRNHSCSTKRWLSPTPVFPAAGLRPQHSPGSPHPHLPVQLDNSGGGGVFSNPGLGARTRIVHASCAKHTLTGAPDRHPQAKGQRFYGTPSDWWGTNRSTPHTGPIRLQRGPALPGDSCVHRQSRCSCCWWLCA